MQDVAPAHYSRAIRQYLTARFLEGWILIKCVMASKLGI